MSGEGSITYYVVLASFVMPILMSVILVWFVVSYQKRKYQNEVTLKDAQLREQTLLLEKQQALQNERTRIAGEMHDDLGGGLTNIKFLSQRVIKKMDDAEQKVQVQKIMDHAQLLVSNMSEIIWAMNAGFDTLDNLIAYSRRYAKEFLTDHGIELQFKVFGTSEGISMSGENRRNVFLVIKEALHNTVKHAEARHFTMEYNIDSTIHLLLQDDGNGLSDQININGNGLENIRKRVIDLGGTITFDGSKGMTIQMELPIQINEIQAST
ncbi:MAG TPA: histidine kinase [Saprospiraceae bacterium]|nr:histidine kinase [Saprospiraceae bacterium]